MPNWIVLIGEVIEGEASVKLIESQTDSVWNKFQELDSKFIPRWVLFLFDKDRPGAREKTNKYL